MSQETDLMDLQPPMAESHGLPVVSCSSIHSPQEPRGEHHLLQKDTVPAGGRWQAGA